MRISTTGWEEEVLIVPLVDTENEETEHADSEPVSVES
jgi:hypothetical protein